MVDVNTSSSFLEEGGQSSSTVQQQWKTCLEKIKEEVSSQTFHTWFLPIIPVSYVDDTLILRVPSRFFFEWVDSHYGSLLNTVVHEVFGRKARMEFLIAPTRIEKEVPLNEEEVVAETEVSEEESDASELDTNFTLENFYYDERNELAYKAAEYIASHTTKVKFNPLVIHGDVGTGKSHLLHAIGNQVRSRRPRANLLLWSAEKFLHEYIAALQSGNINEFKRQLTAVDVFLLDDVQFLSNKKKSQEGLLYILLELAKKKRQIVLTANVPPGNLEMFNPRLISFLQKGLIVDLDYPSVEARKKIVEGVLSANQVELDAEIVDFLVDNLAENMHLLHAALVRIIAQVSLLGRPLDMDQVKFIVAQIYPGWSGLNGFVGRGKPITIERIIEEVAQYFNIPFDILTGGSRKREIVLARQIAVFLAREITGESLARIGYHFNNRNHSSIIHACKKLQMEVQRNPILKSTISQIKNRLLDHL